jgi:hypothetical protein
MEGKDLHLRQTPTLSLFPCDVIIAAGGHVVLKSTHSTVVSQSLTSDISPKTTLYGIKFNGPLLKNLIYPISLHNGETSLKNVKINLVIHA